MAEEREPVEEMESFFDARAHGYEEHMREVLRSFDAFYRAIASPIRPTGDDLAVLDLGCGTGLELTAIWERAPRARITGIDLSARMLDVLRRKHVAHLPQLTLLKGSYLELPFGEGVFDHVVSGMTMHHFPPDVTLGLYARIRRCLRPGGSYIEGDYVVTADEEAARLAAYEKTCRKEGVGSESLRHVDVPAFLATEEGLLRKAGFHDFRPIWLEDDAAVYVAQ
jgi:tRNA (cmo5U34)-methyltransferase